MNACRYVAIKLIRFLANCLVPTLGIGCYGSVTTLYTNKCEADFCIKCIECNWSVVCNLILLNYATISNRMCGLYMILNWWIDSIEIIIIISTIKTVALTLCLLKLVHNYVAVEMSIDDYFTTVCNCLNKITDQVWFSFNEVMIDGDYNYFRWHKFLQGGNFKLWYLSEIKGSITFVFAFARHASVVKWGAINDKYSDRGNANGTEQPLFRIIALGRKRDIQSIGRLNFLAWVVAKNRSRNLGYH